jgi:hypothetical protein
VEAALEGLGTKELIPEDNFGVTDWVAKAALLRRRGERLGGPLTHLQAERVNMAFCGYQVGTKRLCLPLQLARDYGPPGFWHDVIRALRVPPSDTRALMRSLALRYAPGRVATHIWDRIAVEGYEPFMMPDPRVVMTERFREALADWRGPE